MTMKTLSGIGWLTSAEGVGQPIPDAVFMAMSRPYQKSIIV